MKKWVKFIPGYALAALGHLAAIFGVALGTTLLVVPVEHAEGVASRLSSVPQLWEMSQLAIALHVGLSVCIWALLFIAYELVKIRVHEQKRVSTIKLSRGTIVTETLIVMPIFLVLTFGMAQLVINSIGGILANVAAYEAARAAWVWQPEEDATDRRMGLRDGTAEEKCRIAVAFAMMPVAPGDYLKLSTLDSDYADDARLLALGANVPLSGVLSDIIGEDLADLGAIGLGAGQYNSYDEHSYAVSLDSSSFLVRSVRKFTTAFLSARCAIQPDHSVQMQYIHHVTMPLVGPIFGERRLTDGIGLVPGYYSTYRRTFGFQRQAHPPNRRLPLNELREAPALPAEVQSADDVGSNLENEVDNSE